MGGAAHLSGAHPGVDVNNSSAVVFKMRCAHRVLSCQRGGMGVRVANRPAVQRGEPEVHGGTHSAFAAPWLRRDI